MRLLLCMIFLAVVACVIIPEVDFFMGVSLTEHFSPGKVFVHDFLKMFLGAIMGAILAPDLTRACQVLVQKRAGPSRQ